ncbi:MAG: glycosyltransferase family 4 protein [Cyclobacteriaceae bacterium]|nr:glycosyltransferase family 4 protein [Cyclobacteriaceae bacterium]
MPKIKERSRMNLGMILNAPYPPDMRVKKETDALIKAGFRIHLLCLRRKHDAYEEEINGLKISRIDAGRNNYQLAFWDSVIALTFKHPRFMKAMPDWIKKNNISVLHVHDLPLAGTALALRKKIPLQIVVDLHENYPEALRTWFEWKKGLIVKWKNKLFMNPDRWTKHERTAVLESDYVIAVVEEMKKRLIQTHHAAPDKIVIVSNTEDKSFLHQPIDPSVYENFENKFRIVYSGGIGPHRGVDTAIEAMHYLKAYPDIELIIIGSGSRDVIRHLQNVTKAAEVEDHVHFLGYQPFDKFYSFMHLADVNIIPHKSNEHTDNTIPHKLFQSMMSGRPLLVSSSHPLKRVVNATSSGLVFNANNPQDFAAKILLLYQDKDLCNTLGNNGKRATANGTLNWDAEQIILVDFYKRIFNAVKHAV